MAATVTAYADSRLRRARLYVEPAGSYGVDNVGASGLDLPIIEGTPAATPATSFLNPNTLKQFKDARDLQVIGIGSAGLNLSGVLASFGTIGGVAGLDGTQTAVNCPVISGTGIKWPLAQLLAALWGGYSTGPGGLAKTTYTLAGSTTSSINISANGTTLFPPGRAIGLTIAGRMEVREVLSSTATNVIPKVAFSATAADGSTVYNSATVYLTEDPTTSIQMLIEGMNAYDRYSYFGLQGTLGLDFKAGDLPKYSASLKGCGYAGTKSASPGYVALVGLDLAAATYIQFATLTAIRDAEFIVGTVGSRTRTTLNVPESTWTPNFDYVPVTSTATSAFNTMLRQFRTRKEPPASGALTYYRDNAAFDFEGAMAARSVLNLFYQMGSTAGGTICVSVPSVQFSQPTDKPVNNIAAQTCPWWARTDQEIGGTIGTAGELANSCMRIHFL